MPNVRTNTTELHRVLGRLADDLILGRLSTSEFYSASRLALSASEQCGARLQGATVPVCEGTADHEGDHFYGEFAAWADDECVMALHTDRRSPKFAPVGSRVMSDYWRKADDVVAITGGSVIVRDVETGQLRTHCTPLDRRDRVLGPTPN